MVETEYNFRSGVYKVKTFGTTHGGSGSIALPVRQSMADASIFICGHKKP
jgi:hypothetical protein